MAERIFLNVKNYFYFLIKMFAARVALVMLHFIENGEVDRQFITPHCCTVRKKSSYSVFNTEL